MIIHIVKKRWLILPALQAVTLYIECNSVRCRRQKWP